MRACRGWDRRKPRSCERWADGRREHIRLCPAAFSDLCDSYVVSDSTIGFYFLRELSRRGVRVPEEVQVIGFDDSVLAAAADPAMTVVEIDVTNLGKSAARLLIAQLQAEDLCPGQNLCLQGSSIGLRRNNWAICRVILLPRIVTVYNMSSADPCDPIPCCKNKKENNV